MDQSQKKQKDDSLMHDFNEKSAKPTTPMKLIVTLLVIALLGVGTGYGFAKMNSGTRGISGEELTKETDIKVGERYGEGDTKTFGDTAEGVMKEGGIEGEGQFHLERPGGESQTVYLTSSTVDLSLFIDRKVKVWGQTFDAEKAGWLMDVGQLEVLE